MNALLIAAILLPHAVPVAPPPRPVARLVRDEARQVHVLTDRDETVSEFFRRHRAMSGSVLLHPMPDDPKRERGMSLADVRTASKPVRGVYFSYPMWNFRDEVPYGDQATVAPLSPAAVKLLRDGLAAAEKEDGVLRPFSLNVILREDDTVKGLWHVVGYTTRNFLFHKNEALRFTPLKR